MKPVGSDAFAVPVVDLGPWVEPGYDAEARARVARELDAAQEEARGTA